jgi:uncharacterized protein YbcI
LTQPTIRQTRSTAEPTAPPTRDIAAAIARTYREALGCGRNKATVHFVPPATLVVVHEHTMTVEERSLAVLGEHARLREARLILTTALEDRLRSIVEDALGRRTLSFLSGIDSRRDVAVDIFVLEREPIPGEHTTNGQKRPSPRRKT